MKSKKRNKKKFAKCIPLPKLKDHATTQASAWCAAHMSEQLCNLLEELMRECHDACDRVCDEHDSSFNINHDGAHWRLINPADLAYAICQRTDIEPSIVIGLIEELFKRYPPSGSTLPPPKKKAAEYTWEK